MSLTWKCANVFNYMFRIVALSVFYATELITFLFWIGAPQLLRARPYWFALYYWGAEKILLHEVVYSLALRSGLVFDVTHRLQTQIGCVHSLCFFFFLKWLSKVYYKGADYKLTKTAVGLFSPFFFKLPFLPKGPVMLLRLVSPLTFAYWRVLAWSLKLWQNSIEVSRFLL